MTALNFPQVGDTVPSAHPSETMLEMLATRRSTVAGLLQEPGPQGEVLDDILRIAARVPDHRKMVPFRFVVFEGDARAAFGEVLLKAARQRDDEAAQMSEENLRDLFTRAPVVVAVVSSIDHSHKTPEWEQILCAGAVCYNLLLAASAGGFAGQWLSEWPAYDREVFAAMGLAPNEQVAGFMYLGTAGEPPKERPRPEMSAIVTRWQPTP